MKRLSEVLTTTIDQKIFEHAAIAKAWKNAAGDGIDFMTSVVKFSDGVLTIAVHDQTWLSELNFMKGELTERMKGYGLAVSSLSFYYKKRTQRVDIVNHTKKTMTDKEKQYADKLADTVKDEALRESFRKAIYSYFTVYTIDDYLG